MPTNTAPATAAAGNTRPLHRPFRSRLTATLLATLAPALIIAGCADQPPQVVPAGSANTPVEVSSGPTVAEQPGTPADNAPEVNNRPAPRRRVNCAKMKCVALTFDDGPGRYTGRLLAHLRKADVRATFFVLGTQAQRYPGLILAEHRAGMVIGNHSWNHAQFSRLTASAQRAQLARTTAAVRAAGAPRPRLFRPPYGSTNRATRTLGVPLILWNVDPLDWRYRNSRIVADKVVRQTRRGSIILLHDIHSTSVDAVPSIITRLRKKGYVFVTVPELLGSARPGRKYYGR